MLRMNVRPILKTPGVANAVQVHPNIGDNYLHIFSLTPGLKESG